MLKRKWFKTPVSLLMALIILFDFVIYCPMPAQALDKKSVAVGLGVGVAAGAGAVLAAPAIGAALAGAGGLAGIGTAIVGGLAAVGGAIVGVVGAVAGAVGAAVAGIAGWVAGIIASPLFIPALIVIGVAVAGYMIYRHYKKKNAGKCEVLPESVVVTPGEYDMNPVIPPMNQAGGVVIDDSDGLVIAGDAVTVSNDVPIAITGDGSTSVTVSTTGPIVPADFAAIEKRYQEAYKTYTKLATSNAQGDMAAAHKEYKAAFQAYEEAKKSLKK
jgi:hypothetical protein